MTASTYAIGRKERLYLVPEVTYKTAVAYAGTDVMGIKADATLKHDRVEAEVEEKRDAAGVSEVIRNGQHSVTWAVPESDFKPGGVAASEPDFALLMKAFAGSQAAGNNTDAVQASPAPTTTAFAVATVANFVVGSIFRMTSGTYSGSIHFVTGISGSTLTFAPAMAGAASAGNTLQIGWSWPLVEDNNISLSVYHDLIHTSKGASGCQCNELALKVGRAGNVTISGGGDGAGTFSVAGSSTLASGVSATDTSFSVAAGDGDKFLIDSNIGMKVTVEAGGGTEEQVTITSKTGDVMTCSAFAYSHSSSTVVKPYAPAAVRVGSPLSGLVGEFKLDTVAFGMEDFSLTGNNGHKTYDNDFASTTADGFDRDGINPRKINIEISGKFKKDTLLKYGKAIDQDTMALWMKIGNTAHTMVCVYAPKWKPVIPDLVSGGSPIAKLALNGPCLESSTGNDEVFIGVV